MGSCGDSRVCSGEVPQLPESGVPITSYWLDAFEDIDFGEPAAGGGPELIDSSAAAAVDYEDSASFFGEIDRIIESIKNGTGTIDGTRGGGDEGFAELGEILELELPSLPPPPNEGVICGSGGGIGNGIDAHCGEAATEKRGSDELRRGEESVARRVSRRHVEVEGRERSAKRCRLGDCGGGSERNYSDSRRGRGEWSSRKRSRRDWEEIDRRDRERGSEIDRRDRERGGKRDRDRDVYERRDSRDRDWKERDRRGFWERDGNGKVVFRAGSWDVEANRDAKRVKQEEQEAVKSPEKKPEERVEKPPEEQARKYQLDVLEQAKKKNTIAFLETGAGKTLIAVLLIRSICAEMQRANKKMLAIFLVPKVPLVYQVAFL